MSLPVDRPSVSFVRALLGRLAAPAALILLAAFAIPAGAQQQASPEPDAAAMIEALKPRTTRGVRNLGVRPSSASEPAAPVAAPPGPAASAPLAVTPPPATSLPAPVRPGADSPPAMQKPPAEPPNLSLAIQFDFDSARIRAESAPLLAQLALAMKSPELAASRFVIEGHTDASGGVAYNLRLSQARADEVQKFLVAFGVPEARLACIGKGSSAPADAVHPLAAANRRVRVVNVE